MSGELTGLQAIDTALINPLERRVEQNNPHAIGVTLPIINVNIGAVKKTEVDFQFIGNGAEFNLKHDVLEGQGIYVEDRPLAESKIAQNDSVSFRDQEGLLVQRTTAQELNLGGQTYAKQWTQGDHQAVENVRNMSVQSFVDETARKLHEQNLVELTRKIKEKQERTQREKEMQNLYATTGEPSYLECAGDLMIKGNYSDCANLLGVGGSVAAGLAGVDLPMDIRDLSHDFTHWQWTWGHVGQTALDGIGLIPLIGALKNVDEIRGLIKGGDDISKNSVVLGKFPDYIKLADEINAKRFDIPKEIWNKMSDVEKWAANKKFLDRAILRGDNIILSNIVTNIKDVEGIFRKELDYLMEMGYRLSEDGSQMIK